MNSPSRLMLSVGAVLLLSSCQVAQDNTPVRIAAIGPLYLDANPAKTQLSQPNKALLAAISQGLVSYDSDGRIDVGLAERWTVTGDGRSYIFRIRDARWSDGTKVLAKHVAKSLNNYLRSKSRHALRTQFPEIETIKAMTDSVIEIRLKVPQSFLLELLAQPDMSVSHGGKGWGPMRAHSIHNTIMLSKPPPLVEEDAIENEKVTSDPLPSLILIGTSAPQALARFRNKAADSVIGGEFDNFPYYAASDIERSNLKIDPVPGLFGLVFTRAEAFLATDVNRDAVSMAIRRDRLLAAFNLEEWRTQATLGLSRNLRIPTQPPLLPAWSNWSESKKIVHATQRVIQYQSGGKDIPPISIALPPGPGGRIVFAYVAADLRRIGLEARKVSLESKKADLRILDEAAPNDDPIWALRRLNCRALTLCNRDAKRLIKTAELTEDPIERNRLLAEAENIIVRYSPYVPLATPLRWSLTSPRLTGFQNNAQAQHPLDRLAIKGR